MHSTPPISSREPSPSPILRTRGTHIHPLPRADPHAPRSLREKATTRTKDPSARTPYDPNSLSILPRLSQLKPTRLAPSFFCYPRDTHLPSSKKRRPGSMDRTTRVLPDAIARRGPGEVAGTYHVVDVIECAYRACAGAGWGATCGRSFDAMGYAGGSISVPAVLFGLRRLPAEISHGAFVVSFASTSTSTF